MSEEKREEPIYIEDLTVGTPGPSVWGKLSSTVSKTVGPVSVLEGETRYTPAVIVPPSTLKDNGDALTAVAYGQAWRTGATPGTEGRIIIHIRDNTGNSNSYTQAEGRLAIDPSGHSRTPIVVTLQATRFNIEGRVLVTTIINQNDPLSQYPFMMVDFPIDPDAQISLCVEMVGATDTRIELDSFEVIYNPAAVGTKLIELVVDNPHS